MHPYLYDGNYFNFKDGYEDIDIVVAKYWCPGWVDVIQRIEKIDGPTGTKGDLKLSPIDLGHGLRERNITWWNLKHANCIVSPYDILREPKIMKSEIDPWGEEDWDA